MCVPCKVIINNVMAAIVESVEKILVDENLHQGKIPYIDRMRMVDKLRDIDLAAYSGDKIPEGGVVSIIQELEDKWMVIEVPDVWRLLRKPI